MPFIASLRPQSTRSWALLNTRFFGFSLLKRVFPGPLASGPCPGAPGLGPLAPVLGPGSWAPGPPCPPPPWSRARARLFRLFWFCLVFGCFSAPVGWSGCRSVVLPACLCFAWPRLPSWALSGPRLGGFRFLFCFCCFSGFCFRFGAKGTFSWIWGTSHRPSTLSLCSERTSFFGRTLTTLKRCFMLSLTLLVVLPFMYLCRWILLRSQWVELLITPPHPSSPSLLFSLCFWWWLLFGLFLSSLGVVFTPLSCRPRPLAFVRFVLPSWDRAFCLFLLCGFCLLPFPFFHSQVSMASSLLSSVLSAATLSWAGQYMCIVFGWAVVCSFACFLRPLRPLRPSAPGMAFPRLGFGCGRRPPRVPPSPPRALACLFCWFVACFCLLAPSPSLSLSFLFVLLGFLFAFFFCSRRFSFLSLLSLFSFLLFFFCSSFFFFLLRFFLLSLFVFLLCAALLAFGFGLARRVHRSRTYMWRLRLLWPLTLMSCVCMAHAAGDSSEAVRVSENDASLTLPHFGLDPSLPPPEPPPSLIPSGTSSYAPHPLLDTSFDPSHSLLAAALPQFGIDSCIAGVDSVSHGAALDSDVVMEEVDPLMSSASCHSPLPMLELRASLRVISWNTRGGLGSNAHMPSLPSLLFYWAYGPRLS